MASKACCSIPPVVTSNYTPKGSYSEIGGLRTYVTGDKNAKTAVLVIFDIFGFYPQTLQGADIIAAAGNHLVVMPDYFFGSPMDIKVFPPDTPEKQTKLQAFFRAEADLSKAQENTHKFLPALKEEHKSIEGMGVIGYCWGGKITALLSGENTPFKASIQIHPAMVDPENAKAVTIPHMIIASKDEPPEAIAASEENLKNSSIEAVKTKSVVVTYSKMIHGFMAARANLSDPENASEYERGYKQIVDYLQENLTAAV